MLIRNQSKWKLKTGVGDYPAGTTIRIHCPHAGPGGLVRGGIAYMRFIGPDGGISYVLECDLEET